MQLVTSTINDGWTVRDLAGALGISTSWLHRRIKDAAAITEVA
jgi:AraC-like DNA-binding protein